jgi:hypothetical protein
VATTGALLYYVPKSLVSLVPGITYPTDPSHLVLLYPLLLATVLVWTLLLLVAYPPRHPKKLPPRLKTSARSYHDQIDAKRAQGDLMIPAGHRPTAIPRTKVIRCRRHPEAVVTW